MSRKHTGFVYFIQAAQVRRIKIGFSQGTPDSRVGELQVGSPVELTKLALLRGSMGVERNIHWHFASYRVRGEWFRDAKPIRQFVERYATPWPANPYEVTVRHFLPAWAADPVERLRNAPPPTFREEMIATYGSEEAFIAHRQQLRASGVNVIGTDDLVDNGFSG